MIIPAWQLTTVARRPPSSTPLHVVILSEAPRTLRSTPLPKGVCFFLPRSGVVMGGRDRGETEGKAQSPHFFSQVPKKAVISLIL